MLDIVAYHSARVALRSGIALLVVGGDASA